MGRRGPEAPALAGQESPRIQHHEVDSVGAGAPEEQGSVAGVWRRREAGLGAGDRE